MIARPPPQSDSVSDSFDSFAELLLLTVIECVGFDGCPRPKDHLIL